MSIQFRNNVQVFGEGDATVVFSHGFGCDHTMWRLIVPAFESSFRVILYDLVGSGDSDRRAYDRSKYHTLHGYADDLLEIVDAYTTGPVIFVGHSVSAMIGLLAAIKSPYRFVALVLVAPSPCYYNDGDYVGGFNREDLDELLLTMDQDFFGWATRMGPVIMGAPDRPELGLELARDFARNDPDIARHFARVAFMSDHRADLAQCSVPAMILECEDDLLVPHEVGVYMLDQLQSSTLHVVDNVGHCPHLSAPTETSARIETFVSNFVAGWRKGGLYGRTR